MAQTSVSIILLSREKGAQMRLYSYYSFLPGGIEASIFSPISMKSTENLPLYQIQEKTKSFTQIQTVGFYFKSDEIGKVKILEKILFTKIG